MLLIVGGEASGKRSFAESLGYRPEEMACALTGAQRVVYGAHTLVSTQEDVLPALAALRTREVVIMNEVGSGVIPAVRALTVQREAAGRLSVLLAREADCVVRMVCGLPVLLKGTLPCR